MAFHSAETTFGRLLRLPLRLIGRGRVVPILATRARGKRWITGSGPHSCWLGFNEYDKRRSFTRSVAQGSVVWDVGANVGSYTILASVLVGDSGRVIAFEPLPANIAFLKQHVTINHLSNVDVLEYALYDHVGTVRFHDAADRVLGRVDEKGTLEVQAVTMDAAIENGLAPPPSHVKIDTEGAEAAVLRGARKTLSDHRPVIFLATHGAALRQECMDMLRAARYTVTQIGGDPSELLACPDSLEDSA